MKLARTSASPLVGALLLSAALSAQEAQRDTLYLGALQAAAVGRDPRVRQLELARAQTALRLRDIALEGLPSIAIDGQGQHQSAVTTIPIRLPASLGGGIPLPPHDTYDAHVALHQQLLDPSTGPRRAVERAQLARSEAEVRSTLYAVRQQVNDSYFTALQLQARGLETEVALADLDAQRALVEERVQAGTALPADTAAIRAEVLRRREELDQIHADRAAALSVLRELTGRPIDSSVALALPDLAGDVARARAGADSLHARPEYGQFERARDALARQGGVLAAQLKPRLSAFARVGYGRPGLNFLNTTWASYWLVGVEVQWTPWNWGTTARDREVLALQQQVIGTEEAAFHEGVKRGIAHDVATIDRLERALATDEEIIALRERVARDARVRYGEGVTTAADYIGRRTDVLEAKVARDGHRVDLAQARAHYLTTLGLEVR
jgi:outer membrane protein TolC